MKRSSKHSINFTNKHKKEILYKFVSDYRNMLQKYINIIWSTQPLQSKKLLSSKDCNSINSGRTRDSRLRQCAAKQALGIVSGTITKHNKRKYMCKKLQKEKLDVTYLQRKIDTEVPTKPILKNISIELDSRFVDFKIVEKEFNLFVRIKEIGNKEEILIPIKHTKVSKKWLSKGKMLNGIRISNNHITLIFEVPEPIKKTSGKVIGADQGITTCITLSDNQFTKKDPHGHDLTSIMHKISRCTKGSVGFKKTCNHRKNYINWSINQLNFQDIKQINLENVVNIRKGKSNSRFSSSWTYTDIKSKLISKSENEGFTLVLQNNKFRSQRCSKCGWVHKLNRFKKVFKCSDGMCGFTTDSDLNAALNHETELCDISYHKVWYERLNRSTGFYWLKDLVLDHNKKPIVSSTQQN
jgi:transposase